MTENQLGEMQMMEEVAEHVKMNYPETLDSRYVAQLLDDFFFPWEEGSVANPITVEEDKWFSEPRTPVNEPPRQPPVIEAFQTRCLEAHTRSLGKYVSLGPCISGDAD